jgi:hypothetical protein
MEDFLLIPKTFATYPNYHQKSSMKEYEELSVPFPPSGFCCIGSLR